MWFMADFYTEMCFLKVVRQMKDTREENTVSHKNTNQQNNNSSVPSAICPPEKAAVPIQDCKKLYETYSYVPSEEEVAWAEEMVRLTAEVKAEGKGVAVKEGKFIGPPMLKMAEKILSKHKKIISRI